MTAITTILIAIFILLVPGYSTVRAFLRVRGEGLDWTLPEAMFTIVATSILVVSWLGLLLAETGVFSIGWLLAGVMAYGVILWGLFWRRPEAARQPIGCEDGISFGPGTPPGSTPFGARAAPVENVFDFSHFPRPQVGLELLGVVAVLVLAAVLFVQPFDYIIGGLDSGVYVNTGINLAKTGSIIIHDRGIAGISSSEADLFFQPGAVFPGFTIADPASGTVQPHGFHLFPVWIATLYSVGGIKAGLLATPLFGLLGVLGLYFVGRRLFSVPVGLLASFLLAISVGQIWFSRFPVSEVMVQFLLLSGCYLFTLSVDNRSRFLGLLAGASLGMAHLVKIELILLPVSVLGFALLAWAAGRFRGEYWYVLAGYLIMLAHATTHAVLVANNYALAQVVGVFLPAINSLLPGDLELPASLLTRQAFTVADALQAGRLAAAVIVLGAVCLTAIRLIARRWPSPSPRVRETTELLLFGAVVGLAAYAWFVRPYYPPADPGLPQMTAAAEVNNRSSLVRLGWYISPLGVLLGLAGFVKAATAEVNARFLFFIIIVMPTSLLLLYNSFITPVHFWAGRRFVYTVIPTFLLLAAYAIYDLKKSGALRWKANIVLASLVIAFVLTMLRPIAPFLAHVDYACASAQLGDLASVFPENSVVLFEYSLESHMFSTPLEYVYEKEMLMLGRGAESDARFPALVRRYLDRGTRVFWITVANETGALSRRFDIAHVATKQITLPEAPNAQDSLPGKPHLFSTTLEIYELVRAIGD